MRDEETFSVNFATGRTINVDDLRRRRSALMPDGGHAWVIAGLYALDDPESALDDMSLDEKNFVGVSPIYCLLCLENYNTKNRFHKCPQRPRDEGAG